MNENKNEINTKFESFKKLTDRMNEIYRIKNKNYGDSFSKSVDEELMASPRIRLTYKLERFKKLSKGFDRYVRNGYVDANKIDYDDESIEDTLLDMANYSLMTILEIRRLNELGEIKNEKNKIK